MAERTRGIQSIEVGGRILRALTDHASPMTLKDLAQAAELAPAQCHAYLTSFRTLGFIEQDRNSGHYRLGSFAMRLAMSRIRCVPIMEQASRALSDLSSFSNKVAMMVVWGPHGPTVAQFQNGTSAITLNIRQGTLFSVTGTASGRVFAAFDARPPIARAIEMELSGETIERFMGTVEPPEQFHKAIEQDRILGYSATSGLPIPGLNAISAPVFDADGHVILALTLFGAAQELTVDPASSDVAYLLKTTRMLSAHPQT